LCHFLPNYRKVPGTTEGVPYIIISIGIINSNSLGYQACLDNTLYFLIWLDVAF
jgi:hypothetical protein